MAHEADKLNGIRDEQIEQSIHTAADRHVAIHTDTYDIDEDALGHNLPKNYYMSLGFIGTVIVSNSDILHLAWCSDKLIRRCVSATSPTIWDGLCRQTHLRSLMKT
jgi:hypothetical protein